jgi:hypothetical protein
MVKKHPCTQVDLPQQLHKKCKLDKNEQSYKKINIYYYCWGQ